MKEQCSYRCATSRQNNISAPILLLKSKSPGSGLEYNRLHWFGHELYTGQILDLKVEGNCGCPTKCWFKRMEPSS